MITSRAQKRNCFDYRTARYPDLEHLLRADSTAAIYFATLPPHIRQQIQTQAVDIHCLHTLRQYAEGLPVNALSTTVLPNREADHFPRQSRGPLL